MEFHVYLLVLVSGNSKFNCRNRLYIKLSFVLSIAGILSLCFIWMYTLRTVRYLILRKGGKNIAIVTYGPLGNNRIMTVPLDCIKTTGTTQSGISTIPLKVKNILFHYLLDTKGEFTNKALFDHVINLKRRW